MKTDDLGGQARHDMMADPDHDSYSRERFVQEYVWQINGNYHQGNYALYDTKLKPRDGSDMSVQEQRKKVLAEPSGQMWSSLRRVAREWTCEAVGPTVERQLDDLIGKARQYRQSNRKLGSLMLDPSVKVPGYVDVDIHLKPGGYHTELTEDDVFAGAEYERTTYMNTNGLLGPRMDKLGKQVADWVKVTYPKMKPKRILEMGCTIGQSTIAWKEAFPDAEVYGIDVASLCPCPGGSSGARDRIQPARRDQNEFPRRVLRYRCVARHDSRDLAVGVARNLCRVASHTEAGWTDVA
jgi:hypothetical protein